MKNTIETTHLEFTKSAFLIDIVKHNNGLLYTEIVQTITDGTNQPTSSIKINPSALSDIIKTLQNYEAKIANKKTKKKHLTNSDKKEIEKRYFKGVPIKEIAIQFDQTTELIEMILRNKGIEIIENKVPKRKYRRRRRS